MIFAQKRSFAFSALAIAIIIGTFITLSGFISDQEKPVYRNKYFTSIKIEEGDSLWSIASEYISQEYEGIEEYIDELRIMNDLKSDTIHYGQNLTVAYFSDDAK